MADQMINGLPVKTTTQAGDKALISGVTEEYLIDIDKLADIVLSKLTNKNFALDQGTMTLLAALNALNSKFASNAELINGVEYTRLESKANIDALYISGTYVAANDSIAGSIIGKPNGVTRKFKLVVSDTIGANHKDADYKRQRLYPHESSAVYDRFSVESGWSEWVKISPL